MESEKMLLLNSKMQFFQEGLIFPNISGGKSRKYFFTMPLIGLR